VLSEVPGAFTEEEFVRLRAAVQLTGKTYMMGACGEAGENACYWDFLRYFRRWIADGRLGPVSIAEAEYLHAGQRLTGLPHTLWTPEGRHFTPASPQAPSEARARGITDVRPVWRADQPPIQYLTHDLGPLLEVLDDRAVTVTLLQRPVALPGGSAPVRWSDRLVPRRPLRRAVRRRGC
jgi:hypothetical protein